MRTRPTIVRSVLRGLAALALAGAALPAAAQNQTVFSGDVTSHDGAPVAGVVVRLEPKDEHGTLVEANPAFVAEVKKRSAPIIEDWITKANAKGLDAVKILAEFREELKKVAASK